MACPLHPFLKLQYQNIPIMDPVFSRPKFGPMPVGYTPGVGRGAVPFFTRSDIGNAASPGSMIKYSLHSPTQGTRGHEHDRDRGDYSDTLFDRWSGFQEKRPVEKVDPEDDEADKIYADVDEFVDNRRRRHREKSVKELVAKKRKPTVASLFADVKSDLQTITPGTMNVEQWQSIPEVKPHARKKVKQARKLPISDKVLYQAAMEGQVMSFEQTSNSDARGSVIAARLDKVGGMSTARPSVDPVGYITEINSMKVSSEEEISDLKKLRALVKSLTDTNPTHAEGWITAARVEEKDGKLGEARALLTEGLKFCPDSEDIWMETARLAPISLGKEILLRATAALPHSLKLWIALAAKASSEAEKLSTLRQGLEINPESVRLWKEVIQSAPPEDARMYLRKAVTCVPQSLELWLALARLENYENAKAVLSKARKLMPLEFVIWVYAAKLEEANGNGSNVELLITRGLKTLSKAGVALVRSEWLKEAHLAEQSGSTITARAIVKATIHTGIEAEERILRWKEDAENALRTGCVEVAREMLEIGLKTLPQAVELWRKRLDMEKLLKNEDNLRDLYPLAVKQCPEVVDFWLEYCEIVSKDCQMAGIQVLEEALTHHPANIQLFLRLSKLYCAAGDFEKAKKSLIQCESGKAWKQAALLELSQGNTASARQTLLTGIEKYPKYPRLYLLLAGLETDFQAKLAACELGMRQCPEAAQVWELAAKLEETQGTVIRARFLLEKARRHCPSDQVWVHSAGLEFRHGSAKAGQTLLLEGLRKFPQSGELWAEAIRQEPRQTRKAKTVDGLEKCPNSPQIMLEAAKLFWEDRKVNKARMWFQKCVDCAGKWGDAAVLWYWFETLQEESRAEEVLNHLRNRLFKHGEIWGLTCERNSTTERIQEGAKLASSREFTGISTH